MTESHDDTPRQDEIETTVTARPEPPSMAPPVEGVEFDGPEPAWPRVIGVISLIYAVLGLICPTFGTAWMIFADQVIPEMFRGGVEFPLQVKITGAVSWVFSFSLGILMLSGATALLKRRRVGVARLKRWAILRVVVALIGVVIGVLMLPAQVEMQKQAQEFQRKLLEDSGNAGMFKPKSDDQLAMTTMIGTAVSTGMVLAYPVFIGFYLSRRAITAQVETWE